MSKELTLQNIWDSDVSVDSDWRLKVKSTIFWPSRLVGLTSKKIIKIYFFCLLLTLVPLHWSRSQIQPGSSMAWDRAYHRFISSIHAAGRRRRRDQHRFSRNEDPHSRPDQLSANDRILKKQPQLPRAVCQSGHRTTRWAYRNAAWFINIRKQTNLFQRTTRIAGAVTWLQRWSSAPSSCPH